MVICYTYFQLIFKGNPNRKKTAKRGRPKKQSTPGKKKKQSRNSAVGKKINCSDPPSEIVGPADITHQAGLFLAFKKSSVLKSCIFF